MFLALKESQIMGWHGFYESFHVIQERENSKPLPDGQGQEKW